MLDVYLSYLFVCTESLTLVSDPVHTLTTFSDIYIYIYIRRYIKAIHCKGVEFVNAST